MIISVKDNNTVTLDDVDTFTAFHVAVADAGIDVAAALAQAGAGTLLGDEAVITIEWVTRSAGRQDDAEWNTGYQAMLSYAEKKGWLEDEGRGIRAHIEH